MASAGSSGERGAKGAANPAAGARAGSAVAPAAGDSAAKHSVIFAQSESEIKDDLPALVACLVRCLLPLRCFQWVRTARMRCSLDPPECRLQCRRPRLKQASCCPCLALAAH
jgi:hypothetical protein